MLSLQMDQHLNLQKEGLQLFLQTYLTRSASEDISFLKQQITTTQLLAKSINTDLEKGLELTQLLPNQTLYGHNHQTTPHDHKWQKLRELLAEELLTIRTSLFVLTVLVQLISGAVWNQSDKINTSLTNLVLMVLSWVVIVSMRWRACLVMAEGLGLDSAKVSVIRGGDRYEINEQDIVVGDVLFIDFNQRIPASGILISEQEITIDESSFGLGIQRKLSLEVCLQEVESKNELQLKIQREKKLLCSPMILRGSKLIGGCPFYMVVIAVTETGLLKNYKQNQKKLHSKSIIQVWMMEAQEKLQQMVNIALLIIICLHAIALIFKIMGAPSNSYNILLDIIIQTAYILLVLNLLLNTTLMFDLLQGQYLNALNLVGVGEELDRFLSVQQIFITEQNITKYDKINLRKAILADLHEPIDITLLPGLQPTLTYNLICEVMSGVGLSSTLPTQQHSYNHRNIIMHLNNSKERVYSSFYEVQAHPQDKKILQDAEDSVSQLMKSQLKSLNQGDIDRVNRISPQLTHSSNQEMKMQLSIKAISGQRFEDRPEYMKEELPIKLDHYLGKVCHFSTRKIIKGLGKLAKNASRTYYFQKYSSQLLSKVKFLWQGGRFSAIQPQDLQRLIQGIKRLQRQKLSVYLMGMNQGAFCNPQLVFMVGAVGVQIQFQQEIVQKLQHLEDIGINSLFTIFAKEGEELSQAQLQQLESDFMKRKWKTSDQFFRKIKDVYQTGGRRICALCVCTNCSCAAQSYQLSNIQGFLDIMDQTKAIYNMQENQIDYLQQGFQQLNMTTLKIVGPELDTRKKLNQIIAGQQLVTALQEDVILWIILSINVICCFFPFNYITFGKLFGNQQLFLAYFYLQLLFAYHHFTGQPELNMYKLERVNNRKCKKMIGWVAKGNIMAFTVLLISCCVLVMFRPELLLDDVNAVPYIEQYQCQVIKCYFHNFNFRWYKCSNEHENFILYPKLSTFIYVFTLLSITLRAFIALQNPLKIKNIVYHTFLICVLMVILYGCPTILLFYRDGLDIGQQAACWGLAVLVVAFSELVRCLLNRWQHDKSYHYDLNISLGNKYNQYVQILKQYKERKTLQFSYGD